MPGRPIIVAGVSGSGKSTVGALLASSLSYRFIDGDDLHPPRNIDKMASGLALTDDDRWPWLDAIGQLLRIDSRTVVACSALRRSYRERLRASSPEVTFVQLRGTADLIGKRLAERHDHFMPSSLLASQLDTLEALDSSERGVAVNVDRSPIEIVEQVLEFLKGSAD